MLLRIFGWFGETSRKRPWTVIIVIAIISLAMVAGIALMKSSFDYRSMLPQGNESVKALNEVDKNFGGISEEQILLVRDGGVMQPDILAAAASYPAALEGTHLWETFAIRTTTPFDSMKQFSAEDRQVLAAGFVTPAMSAAPKINAASLTGPDLVEQVQANETYSALVAKYSGLAAQSMISSDGKALLITVAVNPGTDSKQQNNLVTEFQDFTSQRFANLEGVQLYQGGAISQSRDSMTQTSRDTLLLFCLAFLFILIVLFLTFRRVSDVALTMMVILVTILWVEGLSGLIGIRFTYMSVAIMPLLLGIDIAYAIHVLSRYYEERRAGNSPFDSSLRSVKTVGVAVFLTAATTAFGFVSFGISNMPPIQQFGLLCVFGVMISFFLAVTLLPACIILRDRSEKSQARWQAKQDKRRKPHGESGVDRGLVRVAMLAEHHRATVGLITLVILAGSIFLGFNVSTKADMQAMMPQDMPSVVATNQVTQYFGGQDQAITLVKGNVFDPAVLQALMDYENRLGQSGLITEKGEQLFVRNKIVSLADIIVLGLGRMPTSETEARLTFDAMQQNGMDMSRMVSADGQEALMVARMNRGTEKDMEKLTKLMRSESSAAAAQVPGLQMQNTGMPVLVNDLLSTIVPTQVKTSGLALILCAAIVILVFGSVTFGLAASSVVFIGIALELGSLTLLKWPLDFMTVMVSSLVIGAGIDFGIHVTHRFREEWHHGGVDVDEAIRRTIANVGKALLAAAVTTAGAFGIIAVSKISFLRRFGGITALSLSFACIAALLVLPSALAVLANRVDRKKERKQLSETAE